MVADNLSTLPNPVISVVEMQSGQLSTIASMVLPKELIEYQDIFLIEEAGHLLSYQGNNYIIKITADLPYGPLYNLSIKELKVLQTYLDDVLVKGWI